jgi:phosphoadenosine phosphosulfate reductase
VDTTHPSDLAQDPSSIEGRLGPNDVRGLVRWAVDRFGERLVLAHSLSIEDTILHHLLDEASRGSERRPRVFTLDTGRLPQESYEQLERLRDRYTLSIETYFPDARAIEALYRQKGPLSFYNSVDDRKECCHIRKVEPLGRALSGAEAWMVGLRREQSPTRASVARVEPDPEHGGIWKLSPLCHLTEEETWALARELDVPVHPLHKRGYPSIGCAPCTRAVQPGEPARAGRWWWEDPSLKECGLHGRRTA